MSGGAVTPFIAFSKGELQEQWPALHVIAHARYRRTVGQLMWTINARPDMAFASRNWGENAKNQRNEMSIESNAA